MARVKRRVASGVTTLALAAATVTGCAAPAVACFGPSSCGSDKMCVAGACFAPSAIPVARLTQRVLVPASEIAVLRSADSRAMPGGSSSAPLGANGAGQVVMLLRFPIQWGAAPVSSAFLLLDPAAKAMPQSNPVAIDVSSILGSFSPGSTRWATRPNLAPAVRRTWATTMPAHVVRIDVTELVAHPPGPPGGSLALALSAAPQAEVGVSLATGVDGDNLPRLDVYLQ